MQCIKMKAFFPTYILKNKGNIHEIFPLHKRSFIYWGKKVLWIVKIKTPFKKIFI